MSGLVYSELANWDGSLSGTQAGNTHESTVSVSGSLPPPSLPLPHSSLMSAVPNVYAVDSAARPEANKPPSPVGYPPNASGSGPSAGAQNERALMDGARRSEELVAAVLKEQSDASKPFSPRARESPIVPAREDPAPSTRPSPLSTPEPESEATNRRPGSPAATTRMRQIMIHRPAPRAAAGVTQAIQSYSRPTSHPEHSQQRVVSTNPTAPIACPSLNPDVPHPHIAQEPSLASSIHVQPQLPTQQADRATHSRASSSARSPMTHRQEGFRDSFTGEDLDAEGETDHESTVSIHAPPVASSSRASASVHVTTERNVRSSAESTAVAGRRAPSREHHIKYTEGSYSDDFLQAVQQHYVSRSPSIPAQERMHSPDRRSASPLQPALSRPFIQRPQSPPPPQQRVQPGIPSVDLGAWLRSPTRRSLSSCEMSPLTTPTASPVSVRTALTKRRRLNQPYVEVPPLPANKPRSAYKLARDIPLLQGNTVNMDYAVQLKEALNHATMTNHDLMRNSESPSVAATPRHRLRPRVAASVPPSKRVSVDISPIIPRKRGWPKGAKDKPKVIETKQFEVREERKSPEAQEEHWSPEVAEEDVDQTHPQADNLEPYLPSSFVELGELPEASATMFMVAFRALIDAKAKHLAGPGGAHPAGKAIASAPAAKDTAPAQLKNEVVPLPRRSMFMKTQPDSLLIAPVLPTSSDQPGPSSSAWTSPQPGYPTQPLSPQAGPSSHARPDYASTVAAVFPSSPHTSPQSAQISAPRDVSPRSTAEHKLYKAMSIESAELALNLFADYDSPRSSGGVSDSNGASDDPTRTPQSIASRSEQSSYGPDVGEGVLHHTQQPRIMQFQHESQYSIAGPSNVADMFAADKALREAQNDHHFDGGMQPDALNLVGSYFSPLDLGIQYESEMGHPWIPDSLSATDNHPAQPNGTIDPSLLGTVVAPGPELRPLIPFPPSASAAGSSNARSAPVPASPGLSRSFHQSHTSMTPSGSSDSDSDRPHSAKRRRVEEQRPQLPIRLLCEMERDSPKRLRRLTERARMSYIELDESDDDLPAPEVKAGRSKGKGKDKDKEKAQAPSDDSFDETSHRVLAEQPTFCHQCRRKSKYEKMRCTTIRDTGELCGLRFCERCVMNRYPDMDFDAYAVRFKCPRYQDICNCTACCARRGEPYISARVGKLPPAGSTEALALAQEALSNSLQPVGHGGVQPSPSPSKPDLVGGQYSGVIYGLGGERVGAGFVGSDNEGIVLGSARGPSKPLSKAVAYIGKPRARAAPPSRSVPIVAEQTAAVSSNNASGANDGGMSNTVLDIPLGIPHGTVIDPLANFSAPTLAADPHPQQHDPVRAGDGLPVPGRRMYIGKRAVLDDPTYVSMDVLPALMEDEDKDYSQEWDAPLSDPISNPADENPEGEHGGQPSTEDVQWAIALALHAVQVVPVQH